MSFSSETIGKSEYFMKVHLKRFLRLVEIIATNLADKLENETQT